MRFSSAAFFIFSLSFGLGFCLMLAVSIFQRRRNKIISMGYLAAGRVTDIIRKPGLKGNVYYEYIIRYQTLSGNVITLRHFTSGVPVIYKVGSEIPLYYNPENPQQYVVKNEPFAGKQVLVVAILLMIAGISALILL